MGNGIDITAGITKSLQFGYKYLNLDIGMWLLIWADMAEESGRPFAFCPRQPLTLRRKPLPFSLKRVSDSAGFIRRQVDELLTAPVHTDP